jgi:hypothetical protein
MYLKASDVSEDICTALFTYNGVNERVHATL